MRRSGKSGRKAMSSSIAERQAATPRETLASVRGSAVKADLKPQVPATSLREVAAEAIRRVTSQKAAATDIGIHEGRLSHKLRDGSLTLAQLEALGPEYGAELGRELVEQYGPLAASPKEHARKVIHEIEARLVELKQFVDVA